MVCQKPEKRRFELQYLHRRTEDLYNHRFAHAKVCGGCGGGALERVAGTILQREKRTLNSPVQQQSDTGTGRRNPAKNLKANRPLPLDEKGGSFGSGDQKGIRYARRDVRIQLDRRKRYPDDSDGFH